MLNNYLHAMHWVYLIIDSIIYIVTAIRSIDIYLFTCSITI